MLVSKTVCVNSRKTGVKFIWVQKGLLGLAKKSTKEHEIKEERSEGVSMY